MTRLAIFWMAMMDAGMRGTHASRATTGGRDRGARQANRVSGASTA